MIGAALRAEILKLRTTKTILALLAAMVGLVLLVVLMHALGGSVQGLATRQHQLRALVEGGPVLGSTFAALAGAMSITAEIRHGTIRPTFLGIPQRGRVIAAKAITSVVAGLLIGLVATGLAAAVGTVAITSRGIPIQLSAADYARLVAGGAGAAALWAGIGLGVGVVVRDQVAAIVGIFLWKEIVENVLVDGAPGVSPYMPGVLVQGVAGAQAGTVNSLALGLLLLAAYTAAAAVLGWRTATRRDFA